jgi:glycosyltransferase involved in cell wall biosynthesis
VDRPADEPLLPIAADPAALDSTVRILYFYQYFGTTKGSWSTRVYEFTRRWVRAGDSVTVVTSVYDKSDLRPKKLISRYDIEGVDVRVINVRLSNKHGFLPRVLTYALFALISCWYALVLPADVVVASSGPITVGLPGLVARYLRRIPLVFEVRDLWPEGAIQLGVLRNRFIIAAARLCERICYRAASRIVVLSDGMRRWIEDTYGYDHIEVIPNVSDNQLFGATNGCGNGDARLQPWARGKYLALYTGTMGLMDDCRQLLDMAEHLQKTHQHDIQLILIGDGKERPELEADAKRRQLANIRFLGLLTKEEVAGWLRHATCSLLAFRSVPAMDTVSPNKMFDAFAAGVPVVQATQGWIKDLLVQQQCGLTVAAGDAAGMATAVSTLARDCELHARLSGNARRVAREMFDCDLLASRMRNVITTAARKDR